MAETAQLSDIQALLDRLGDAARVLNAELDDCPSTKMLVAIAVPPGLELWCSRRLQTSGLVSAAFPDVQARDPSWTAPFIFAAAVLKPALLNATTNKQRYQAIWAAFEQRLSQFAAARRPSYASSGHLARLGGGPEWMYRAELTGRALAICHSNRWEKITVQASANAFDAES